MKKTIRKSIRALLFTASLTTVSPLLAQRVEATSTITSSEGTISEFGPQAIVIKVTSGLPMTVYFTKVGDTSY